jgi:drug/metabolite transporter (DMT)-like permease
MPSEVVAAVLLGALLHATWNAILKKGGDAGLDAATVALGAAVTALVLLPFVPVPPVRVWPFILASTVLQTLYFHLLGAAARAGDLGLVYPVMRGSAPLIAAAASSAITGEALSFEMLAGILAISGGVLTLAVDARATSGKAVVIALVNAAVIASYSFVDGLGARAMGHALGYTLWISLLPPIPLLALAGWRRGRGAIVGHLRRHWPGGLAAGAASIASYALALWAMTQAPIATVAALRETSILFAVVIGVAFLGEKPSHARLFGAGTIAVGALALKLG